MSSRVANLFSQGTKIGKGGPVLAAKIGPAGPILAAKVVRGNNFGKLFSQNRSGRTDFREDRFWRDRPIIIMKCNFIIY